MQAMLKTILKLLWSLIMDMCFSSLYVQGNSCPNGWTFFEGSCYFFSNQTATWVNARERCKEIGGDLVNVSSDSQNAFVSSHYSSLSCLSEGAWIGLHRNPRNTSRWVWLDELDAEPVYTKWHRKEPMNDRLDKNCTEIHPTKSIYWFGRECSAQGCYICVKGKHEKMLWPNINVIFVLFCTRELIAHQQDATEFFAYFINLFIFLILVTLLLDGAIL